MLAPNSVRYEQTSLPQTKIYFALRGITVNQFMMESAPVTCILAYAVPYILSSVQRLRGLVWTLAG